jgi:hypothetical protein
LNQAGIDLHQTDDGGELAGGHAVDEFVGVLLDASGGVCDRRSFNPL